MVVDVHAMDKEVGVGAAKKEILGVVAGFTQSTFVAVRITSEFEKGPTAAGSLHPATRTRIAKCLLHFIPTTRHEGLEVGRAVQPGEGVHANTPGSSRLIQLTS